MGGEDGEVDDVAPGSTGAVPDLPDLPPAPPRDEDDDLWLADDGPRGQIPPIVIVLAAVAVLGVIIVLLATRGGNDDDPAASGDGSAQVADGGDGATTTTVKRGPAWPKVVQGRPAVFGQLREPITSVKPDAAPGVYLWLDFDGWHLWIVDPSGKAAARGTLVSGQDFGTAQTAVPGEGTVTVAGKNLDFDVSTVNAKAAGVTFNLGFYATDLTVTLQGSDLPLLLGAKAQPSPVPTVITKAVQPS